MSSLAFLALVLVFVMPAVRLVRLWDTEERFGPLGGLALGFVVALGSFSALTGPLLLAQAPFAWAIGFAAVGWLITTLTVEGIARRRRAAPPQASEHSNWTAVDRAEGPADGPALALPSRASAASVLLVLAAGLGCCWLAAGDVVSRPIAFSACALLGLTAALVARRGWVQAGRGASIQTVPRGVVLAARVVLVPVVVVLLASSVMFVREDLDDVLYMSEALALQEAPAMRFEAAAHRGEGLPSNVVYAWQTWELWSATLCVLSGEHTLVANRTLLAPVLVACALVLSALLLRRALPRQLVPIAMLVLCAYFLWGMSSHWTANNSLLTRSAQGKTWLVHVGLPALILLGAEVLRRPRWSTWLLLLLASFAALGWAPTAVFLVPLVLGPLALAHVAAHGLKASRGVGPLLAAVLPQLAFGAWLALGAERMDDALALDWGTVGRWRDRLLFSHLDLGHGGGALELFALCAVPCVAVLMARREQRIYPVLFTCVFFATSVNPLVYPLLSEHAVGETGYSRLFWGVPFGLLLAVAGASIVALAARAWRAQAAAPLALVAVVAVFPLVGGRYVWSAENVYPDSAPVPAPTRAENAYKMPGELLAIARRLQRATTGPGARILCNVRTASHLAPFERTFDFVFARSYQTIAPLRMAGRETEAEQRRALSEDFLEGGRSVDELGGVDALRSALDQARTRFVVLDRRDPAVESALAQAGFSEWERAGVYSLWALR